MSLGSAGKIRQLRIWMPFLCLSKSSRWQRKVLGYWPRHNLVSLADCHPHPLSFHLPQSHWPPSCTWPAPLLPLHNLFFLLHFPFSNFYPKKLLLFLQSLSLTHQHVSHYPQARERGTGTYSPMSKQHVAYYSSSLNICWTNENILCARSGWHLWRWVCNLLYTSCIYKLYFFYIQPASEFVEIRGWMIQSLARCVGHCKCSVHVCGLNEWREKVQVVFLSPCHQIQSHKAQKIFRNTLYSSAFWTIQWESWMPWSLSSKILRFGKVAITTITRAQEILIKWLGIGLL